MLWFKAYITWWLIMYVIKILIVSMFLALPLSASAKTYVNISFEAKVKTGEGTLARVTGFQDLIPSEYILCDNGGASNQATFHLINEHNQALQFFQPKCKKGVVEGSPEKYGIKPLDVGLSVVTFFNGLNVWANVVGMADPNLKICLYGSVASYDQDIFSCVTTPIANDVSCSVAGGVTINHGTVSNSAINNHTASVPVNVTCTGATDANIKIGPSIFDPSGKISLGSGITSEFNVNSTTVGSSGVNTTLKSGSNTVNITSILKASGKPAGGTYSGQGILFINTQ